MEFDLTPEQEEFRRTVRSFAEEVVRPRAEQADRAEALPLDVVRAMGDLGLFGVPFPEEYGGQGADLLTFCLAVEELGRVDQSVGITLAAAVGLGAMPILRFGTGEQRERHLPSMCRGEAIGAFALTEPEAGSDAAAIRTRAREEGEGWVLEGTKAFITNAGTPLTSLIVAAAVTDPDEGAHGISQFLVPSDAPGLVVGPPYRKLGWRASDTHEVAFQGCRVPGDHLLGERGRGLAQALEILDGGRITTAALSVGLAQACLDAGLAYARERRAFGRPIGAFQAIGFKLADMRVAVETARLATYRAAWLRDRGRPHTAAAALAKLHASEAAVRCAREAVQIFGGAGFIEGSPVARYYRDAKVLEIGEGTSEMQRLVIARELGLPEPA
ncbi:MAG TPA: acyl-CoA dehydrogenase family protein [Actinomycetota bacterium]|nr:acyl-CoA dehydrogenase family protein [Actinomycetota bacterium]